MIQDVLFVVDKFCSGDSKLGFSLHHLNFINTFEETQLNSRLHTLYYDESLFIYNTHIDNILLKYCKQNNIKTIFFSFGGHSPMHPTLPILEKLKEEQIFLSFIWCDSNPSELYFKEKIRHLADLNIMVDNAKSEIHDILDKTEKDLHLWTPESKNYFYPDSQNTKVSFIGSPRYQERYDYLVQLVQKVPNFVTIGGQRETGMSFSKYADLIRKSQIGLNFCGNPMGLGYKQVKGRVFEIIASKSLLLEESGSGASNFFTPNVDYIEFENIQDLVDKIGFYSDNKEEREKIVANGYKRFIENYTAHHFWDKVMEKIK